MHDYKLQYSFVEGVEFSLNKLLLSCSDQLDSEYKRP